MATNEQIRRGIGANNEAARRSIGSGNEAARRNIGRSNIAERTGLVDDLNRLVNSGTATKTLKTIEPRGARPAAVGVATYTAPATGGGGGIASPLTEKTRPETQEDGSVLQVPDRDYWPTMIMTTTEGLLVYEVRPLKEWRFTDADGNNVQINPARPKAAST